MTQQLKLCVLARYRYNYGKVKDLLNHYTDMIQFNWMQSSKLIGEMINGLCFSNCFFVISFFPVFYTFMSSFKINMDILTTGDYDYS